jgi:hypothetical protein
MKKPKAAIINEIEEDFRIAYQGVEITHGGKFGVYTALFITKALTKLKHTLPR